MKRHTAKLMGLYLLAATAGACAPDAEIDTEPDPLVEDDPGTPTTNGDECEINGWYGDGVCDLQCPSPDPDCAGGQGQQPPPGDDLCEDNGWYGDGYCDLECAFPDPDCDQQGGF